LENPVRTHEISSMSRSSASEGATGTGRSWNRWRARCSESPNASAGDGACGTRSWYWNSNFFGQVSYVLIDEYESRIAVLSVRSAIPRC
jgi:hypothetical protein